MVPMFSICVNETIVLKTTTLHLQDVNLLIRMSPMRLNLFFQRFQCRSDAQI